MQTASIPRRRLVLRNAQRGMTILEIMIVLAILALVMGFLIGPRIMALFGKSKEDLAALAVKRYADDAYPLWSRDNPGKACPGSLKDLNVLVNIRADKPAPPDPWGGEYVMLCGPNMPPGVGGGFAVYSPGPDMKPNTTDDIKSWE